MSTYLRDAARSIFAEAMAGVDVQDAVRRSLSVRHGTLHVAGQTMPLTSIDEVLTIAMGKAAVSMTLAACECIDAVPHRTIVVAPRETLAKLPQTAAAATNKLLIGDHPTPTINSTRAADEILSTLRSVTGRTVVLFLISGGASAMVERPLHPAISLDDLAMFSRALVGSGMNIAEINTLRKHLSAVKGGRLAVAAGAAAMQGTLLLSDVPAALPDVIASGPSLPDSSTVADAKHLSNKLQQVHAIPSSLQAWFASETLPETPKPAHPVFARSSYGIILSSEHLAMAAQAAATAHGFRAIIDDTCDDWEYRDAAHYLLDRGRFLSEKHSRMCLISVGEVGVQLPHDAGEGGRNQQLALWCAAELTRRGQHATVLSAGSDGVDGHSAAAGAVCDETTVQRAEEAGLDVQTALAAFNATPLLTAVGDVITTGPTGNNLRDLRLILTG